MRRPAGVGLAARVEARLGGMGRAAEVAGG